MILHELQNDALISDMESLHDYTFSNNENLISKAKSNENSINENNGKRLEKESTKNLLHEVPSID